MARKQADRPGAVLYTDKIAARKALVTAAYITICLMTFLLAAIFCLMIFLLAAILWRETRMPSDHRIEDYKLHLEAFKVVLIGSGATLLGILVPAILTEAKNNFERLKDSRRAYSEAKTGVEYLPLRLCSLPLKDAATLIQSIHVQKHQAELYDELGKWLKRKANGDPKKQDPATWSDEMSKKLSGMHDRLVAHAASWDALSPDARLKLLGVEQHATRGPSETGS